MMEAIMKRTKRECYIGDDGYCHVPLANGKGEAITDAEFIEEVNKHSWIIHSQGYACTYVGKRIIFLHRFIFALKFNEIKNVKNTTYIIFMFLTGQFLNYILLPL